MFLLAFIRERSEPSESCQAVAAVELAAAANKTFESKAAASRFWQKGRKRVWIDNNLYLA